MKCLQELGRDKNAAWSTMYYRNTHRTWGRTLHLLPLPDVATSACIHSVPQHSIRQRLPSNWGGLLPWVPGPAKKPPALPSRSPVSHQSPDAARVTHDTSLAFQTAGRSGACSRRGEGIWFFCSQVVPSSFNLPWSWARRHPPATWDREAAEGMHWAVPSWITKHPGIPPAPWSLSRQRRKRRPASASWSVHAQTSFALC